MAELNVERLQDELQALSREQREVSGLPVPPAIAVAHQGSLQAPGPTIGAGPNGSACQGLVSCPRSPIHHLPTILLQLNQRLREQGPGGRGGRGLGGPPGHYRDEGPRRRPMVG